MAIPRLNHAEVRREAWGEFADQPTVMPLDLEAEVRRWGTEAAVR